MSYYQQTIPNYQQGYSPNYQQYPQQTMQQVNYQQSYPQNAQQNNQQQIQTVQQPQIQNGGIMHVRNMQEAFNYPVAPGTSVTFKDENAPFVYTKTRGFSQMEQPIFDVYELKKVENTPQGENSSQKDDKKEKTENLPSYVLQEEFERLCDLVDTLQDEIKLLKKKNEDEPIITPKKSAPRTKKKEEAEDDA